MSSTPPTHPPSTPELDPFCPGRLRCVLYAILVMAPWPLIGLAITKALGVLGGTNEISLLFGGITIFPLLIVHALLNTSESILNILIYVAWFAVAVLPPLLLARWLEKRSRLFWMLGTLSAFSLVQALMGGLMLLTKSV